MTRSWVQTAVHDPPIHDPPTHDPRQPQHDSIPQGRQKSIQCIRPRTLIHEPHRHSWDSDIIRHVYEQYVIHHPINSRALRFLLQRLTLDCLYLLSRGWTLVTWCCTWLSDHLHKTTLFCIQNHHPFYEYTHFHFLVSCILVCVLLTCQILATNSCSCPLHYILLCQLLCHCH